jgi:hypothetical protein
VRLLECTSQRRLATELLKTVGSKNQRDISKNRCGLPARINVTSIKPSDTETPANNIGFPINCKYAMFRLAQHAVRCF